MSERRSKDPGQDLVRHVAEEITPEITAFMGTVAGTPSFQLGELVGDEVKFWRFKRSLRHAQKAKEMLDAAGLAPHQVPFRTLVPLVESASLEDDDGLTEKWAALLANAAGRTSQIPPSFPAVLRELEPMQARMLDRLFNVAMGLAPNLRSSAGVSRDSFRELTNEEYEYHADNLRRLRLAQSRDGVNRHILLLTAFGQKFVRACRPPGTPDPPIVIETYQQLLELEKASAQRPSEKAAPKRPPEAGTETD